MRTARSTSSYDQRPAVEGAGQGGEEVGVAQPGAGEVVADGLDVLELERPAFPEGGQLVDVQAAQQLVAALHRRHVGGGQGQAEAGGGDPLVERLGELLDRQQAALATWTGVPRHMSMAVSGQQPTRAAGLPSR